jgi:hypothetical protein
MIERQSSDMIEAGFLKLWRGRNSTIGRVAGIERLTLNSYMPFVNLVRQRCTLACERMDFTNAIKTVMAMRLRSIAVDARAWQRLLRSISNESQIGLPE